MGLVRMEGHGGSWGIGRGEEGSERGEGDAERLFIARGMGIRVILLWDKLGFVTLLRQGKVDFTSPQTQNQPGMLYGREVQNVSNIKIV